MEIKGNDRGKVIRFPGAIGPVEECLEALLKEVRAGKVTSICGVFSGPDVLGQFIRFDENCQNGDVYMTVTNLDLIRKRLLDMLEATSEPCIS